MIARTDCTEVVIKDASIVKGAPIINSLVAMLSINEVNLAKSKDLIRKPCMK
jgi:hypothetical protein